MGWGEMYPNNCPERPRRLMALVGAMLEVFRGHPNFARGRRHIVTDHGGGHVGPWIVKIVLGTNRADTLWASQAHVGISLGRSLWVCKQQNHSEQLNQKICQAWHGSSTLPWGRQGVLSSGPGVATGTRSTTATPGEHSPQIPTVKSYPQ